MGFRYRRFKKMLQRFFVWSRLVMVYRLRMLALRLEPSTYEINDSGLVIGAPVPVLKRSLVEMATEPLPDRQVDFTGNGLNPIPLPASQLNRSPVVRMREEEE